MKHSHIVSLMQNDYTTCTVQYTPIGRRYTFKVRKDKVVEGSIVVVESNADFGFSIGMVSSVHDTPQIDTSSTYDYKWIVAVVNTTAYAEMKEREAALAAKIAEVEKAAVARQVLERFKAQFGDDKETLALLDSITETAQKLGDSTNEKTNS